MRGQAFKSFIFLCFSFLFAQFNSQWADNFLRSSSASFGPHELMAEMMTETFLNTKAVTIGVKNVSKQVGEIFSLYFSNTEKIIVSPKRVQDYNVTTVTFCAVKSYLHLLQLF